VSAWVRLFLRFPVTFAALIMNFKTPERAFNGI